MSQADIVGLGNALMDALYILESDDFLAQETLIWAQCTVSQMQNGNRCTKK